MGSIYTMGWLWLLGSLRLEVSFVEYSLFYRALLKKRPILLRSLLIVGTPYVTSYVGPICDIICGMSHTAGASPFQMCKRTLFHYNRALLSIHNTILIVVMWGQNQNKLEISLFQVCKESYLYLRGLCVCSKEPYLYRMDPYLCSKEPHLCSKEPYLYRIDPTYAQNSPIYALIALYTESYARWREETLILTHMKT